MKKQILNLGKALNKAEQKHILGGNVIKKYDPNCDQFVNEGTCWGYRLHEFGANTYGFIVTEVGGGVVGSGYYEYPCDC